MGKQNRFESKKVGSSWANSTKLFTDRTTGVQYLYVAEGYGAGLTVLVDKDGKPLLNPNYEPFVEEEQK